MQSAYTHSPPNQTRHSGIFDGASPLASSHRIPASTAVNPDRGSHGLKIPQLLYSSTSQDAGSSLNAPYSHLYERNATGSAEQPGGILGSHRPHDSITETPVNAANHTMSAGHHHHHHHPQKRAYRQRRKDPSCDACRERKVKCDASDSASCTECSNRNVRCLFTKETNRRMSSIKQVQDLERQLAQTRQQLNQLRSGIPKIDNLMEAEYSLGDENPKIPELGYRPRRLVTPNFNHNLSNACSNMRLYGQGLVYFPPTPSYVRQPQAVTTDGPPLPPASIVDALLKPYLSCVHSVFPLFHWPTFLNDYDRICRAGSFHGTPRGWVAVFFSALACGSLHSVDANLISKGKEYLQTSVNLIDLWQDSFTVEQVQASILISMFLYEFNLKSASWVWLGSAVRISQDLGLHAQCGQWSALETETRRRLWWSLYSWERLVVLELGRPLYINDEDCDVDLPSPADERQIPDGTPTSSDQRTTPLLAVIHVTRAVSHLNRTLKTSVISPDTLEVFERHFRMCLATFPPDYRMKSDQYLDPRSLAPIIYLQNTRLLLHRHNISPSCSPEVRHVAMDQCLAVAHDTTRMLLRCMRSPTNADGNATTPPGNDWRYHLASSATTILCTHIWRCILFLLFRAEYSAALVCIQACSAIGDSRAVNICSGRYITFFLRCLMARKPRNETSDLEHDEEMMAYVSGDFQSRIDSGWVWRNIDVESPRPHSGPSQAQSSPTKPPSSTKSMLADNEQMQEWDGWEWIERTVEHLLNEQQKSPTAVDRAVPDNHPAPASSSPTEKPASSQNQPSASSRMTIANII